MTFTDGASLFAWCAMAKGQRDKSIKAMMLCVDCFEAAIAFERTQVAGYMGLAHGLASEISPMNTPNADCRCWWKYETTPRRRLRAARFASSLQT